MHGMSDAAQFPPRLARAICSPLAGIVAGTVLCMALLACGCATRREVVFDAKNPAVRVSRQGILFGDTFVNPQDVPDILDGYDVPKTRTIHIRLDPDVRNLAPARTLMGYLCRAGYMSPVLVTERHAESVNRGKPNKAAAPLRPSEPQPRKIRYKRANE